MPNWVEIGAPAASTLTRITRPPDHLEELGIFLGGPTGYRRDWLEAQVDGQMAVGRMESAGDSELMLNIVLSDRSSVRYRGLLLGFRNLCASEFAWLENLRKVDGKWHREIDANSQVWLVSEVSVEEVRKMVTSARLLNHLLEKVPLIGGLLAVPLKFLETNCGYFRPSLDTGRLEHTGLDQWHAMQTHGVELVRIPMERAFVHSSRSYRETIEEKSARLFTLENVPEDSIGDQQRVNLHRHKIASLKGDIRRLSRMTDTMQEWHALRTVVTTAVGVPHEIRFASWVLGASLSTLGKVTIVGDRGDGTEFDVRSREMPVRYALWLRKDFHAACDVQDAWDNKQDHKGKAGYDMATLEQRCVKVEFALIYEDCVSLQVDRCGNPVEHSVLTPFARLGTDGVTLEPEADVLGENAKPQVYVAYDVQALTQWAEFTGASSVPLPGSQTAVTVLEFIMMALRSRVTAQLRTATPRFDTSIFSRDPGCMPKSLWSWIVSQGPELRARNNRRAARRNAAARPREEMQPIQEEDEIPAEPEREVIPENLGFVDLTASSKTLCTFPGCHNEQKSKIVQCAFAECEGFACSEHGNLICWPRGAVLLNQRMIHVCCLSHEIRIDAGSMGDAVRAVSGVEIEDQPERRAELLRGAEANEFLDALDKENEAMRIGDDLDVPEGMVVLREAVVEPADLGIRPMETDAGGPELMPAVAEVAAVRPDEGLIKRTDGVCWRPGCCAPGQVVTTQMCSHAGCSNLVCNVHRHWQHGSLFLVTCGGHGETSARGSAPPPRGARSKESVEQELAATVLTRPHDRSVVTVPDAKLLDRSRGSVSQGYLHRTRALLRPTSSDGFQIVEDTEPEVQKYIVVMLKGEDKMCVVMRNGKPGFLEYDREGPDDRRSVNRIIGEDTLYPWQPVGIMWLMTTTEAGDVRVCYGATANWRPVQDKAAMLLPATDEEIAWYRHGPAYYKDTCREMYGVWDQTGQHKYYAGQKQVAADMARGDVLDRVCFSLLSRVALGAVEQHVARPFVPSDWLEIEQEAPLTAFGKCGCRPHTCNQNAIGRCKCGRTFCRCHGVSVGGTGECMDCGAFGADEEEKTAEVLALWQVMNANAGEMCRVYADLRRVERETKQYDAPVMLDSRMISTGMSGLSAVMVESLVTGERAVIGSSHGEYVVLADDPTCRPTTDAEWSQTPKLNEDGTVTIDGHRAWIKQDNLESWYANHTTFTEDEVQAARAELDGLRAEGFAVDVERTSCGSAVLPPQAVPMTEAEIAAAQEQAEETGHETVVVRPLGIALDWTAIEHMLQLGEKRLEDLTDQEKALRCDACSSDPTKVCGTFRARCCLAKDNKQCEKYYCLEHGRHLAMVCNVCADELDYDDIPEDVQAGIGASAFSVRVFVGMVKHEMLAKARRERGLSRTAAVKEVPNDGVLIKSWNAYVKLNPTMTFRDAALYWTHTELVNLESTKAGQIIAVCDPQRISDHSRVFKAG